MAGTPVAMEITELNVESRRFVNALERVLPRFGYRSMRSFDLHADGEAVVPIPRLEQCQCGCGYTVLLVFANKSQAGLEGTISVRGVAEHSVVTLLSSSTEGELEAQFPSILVEAMLMKMGDGGASSVSRQV